MANLDRRGRLGDPPNPLWLAWWTSALIALLGFVTFVIGRVDGAIPILVIAAFAVFGLATAIGVAMATAQYRSLQELDAARAELLALYSEIDHLRRDREDSGHDIKTIAAALGAAAHALQSAGEPSALGAAISLQVALLQDVLRAEHDLVEPVSLDSLRGTVESFAHVHGVPVVVDLPSNCSVLAAPTPLSEIMQNLLDNARKYAPGSEISVGHEAAGPYHRIVVEDAGPGVDPSLAPTMFSSGVRTADDQQGFGMGLAASRHMAERMGGSLWYEPRPGGGARFIVKLRDGAPSTT